eukprot:COSAG06_NODE_1983_length_7920_cov_4.287303_3_plen_188_part_00
MISFSPVRAPFSGHLRLRRQGLASPVACPRSCGVPNRPAVRGSVGWLPVALPWTKPSTPPRSSFVLHEDEETAVAERSRWRTGGGMCPVWLGSVQDHERARREIAQRLTVMVREAWLKPRCSFSLCLMPAAAPRRQQPIRGRARWKPTRRRTARRKRRYMYGASRPPSCRLRERIGLVWRRRRCRRR